MKIAILGYGKMGKIIEQIAQERGHEVSLKINSSNLSDLNLENLKTVDVAIEFSNPESAVKNIKTCIASDTPVAIGTTGWYDSFEEIKSECTKQSGCMLAATNFSVGVNIFFAINKRLAELMEGQKDYVADVQEIHHLEKFDSPSGTAISIAEQIIENNTAYTGWKNSKKTTNDVLNIESLREPKVPGTHEVFYRSEIDTLSIKHVANNRNGFALGAVLAAEFIHNKTGIFTMQDVLN